MAAAQLVRPGERVHVCAGQGVVEAMQARGAVLVDDGPADVVVVGFHREFDYERLRRAATAVRDGARLIGTNDDPVYPTPDGPIPGGGAILAAVRTAAGVQPVIAGKPCAPMAELVRATVGKRAAADAVMVGDRPDTDGRFAERLGCRFALVWSGVTSPGDVLDPVPDLDGADLQAVVEALIGSDG
jgi:4-nitrophenyl phosphatase